MKTLVLNCGSSSIKYQLFDMEQGKVLAKGGIEKIGFDNSIFSFKNKAGIKTELIKNIPNHEVGIECILSLLTDEEQGCIKSFNEIDAVGHRIVHGGDKFSSSALIGSSSINTLGENERLIAVKIRCCSPPDNSSGLWFRRSANPRKVSSSPAFCSAFAFDARLMYAGMQTFSSAVNSGNK